MKKFIGILLALYLLTFLFGQDQADFPGIYIDAGVGGTHVGSLANPYDDISDINWTTGGDNSIFDWYAGAEDASVTINLMKGDEWRETLTVGASGSATYPIIIQSYGSGAKPIINGSDLVATWTATPGTNYEEHANIVSWWYLEEESGVRVDGSANNNDLSDNNTVLFSADSQQGTNSADFELDTSEWLEIVDGSQAGLDLTGSFTIIGWFKLETAVLGYGVSKSQDSNDYYYLRFSSGRKAELKIGDGTATESCLGAALDLATWYHIAGVFDSGNDLHLYVNGSTTAPGATIATEIAVLADNTGDFCLGTLSGVGGYYDGLMDEVAIFNTALSSADINRIMDDGLDGSAYTNVWQASFTDDPILLWIDGTFGDEKTAIGDLADEYDWYYTSNVIYLYAASDPDGLYTKIEAGKRNTGISTDTTSYLAINGIHIKNTRTDSMYFEKGDDIEINSCTMEEAGYSGVETYCADNVIIDDCTINHTARGSVSTGWMAVKFQASLGFTNTCTIKNSTIADVHGDTGQGVTITDNSGAGTLTAIVQNNSISDVADDGVKLYGSVNSIVEHNVIHHCGHTGTGSNNGIVVIRDCSNVTVRYNKIDDQSDGAIAISGSDGAVSGNVYYNLLYDNNSNEDQNKGCILVYQNSGTVNLYNNVVYNDALKGLYIQQSSNITAKNNVFMNNTGEDLYVTGTSTPTLDNNCYYRSSGSIIEYEGNAYTVATFSTYQSEQSQDANGIAQDPLFIDAASDDFRLLMASPCIDAGADVGLTADYRGRSIRHAPDIGAYENSTNSLFLTKLFNRILTQGSMTIEHFKWLTEKSNE